MDAPIDIETGALSPKAKEAVDHVKKALKKTGHVAEAGLEDAAKAAVVALMAAGQINFGS